MSTENREVVTRWFEQVWSKGRLDWVETMLHPACVGHGLDNKDGTEVEGIEEHKRFIKQLRDALQAWE